MFTGGFGRIMLIFMLNLADLALFEWAEQVSVGDRADIGADNMAIGTLGKRFGTLEMAIGTVENSFGTL